MSTYVAVLALVLAYVALVAAYFSLRTLAKLRRASSLLARGARSDDTKQSLMESTANYAEQTMSLAEQVAQLREQLESTTGATHTTMAQHHEQTLHEVTLAQQQLRDEVDRSQQRTLELADQIRRSTLADVERAEDENAGALRNVALVRYDALSGMSGRMSFSLAILDDSGTGVTISALAAQSDTRVYAKGITGGHSDLELSPEEAQAVTAAFVRRRRRRPAAPAGPPAVRQAG